MRRILAAAIAAVVFLCGAQQDSQFILDHPDSSLPFVRYAMLRLVDVVSADGVCTGVVVAKDRVLTASHCLAEGKQLIYADSKGATAFVRDAKRDLLLLRVATSSFHALRIEKPRIIEEVFAARQIGEWKKNDPPSRGRIVERDRHFLYTTTVIERGMSGGGLFNKEGSLVGILIQYRNAKDTRHRRRLAVAVPGDEVAAFVREAERHLAALGDAQ